MNGSRRDREVREVEERIGPVPARRLGQLLRQQRARSVRAESTPGAIEAGVLDDLESGRGTADAAAIAALMEGYGCSLDELVPPRHPLVPASLRGGSDKEVLEQYLAAVRAWRASGGRQPQFRREDIDVLVGILGCDSDEILRRLVGLTGCSRTAAKRMRRLLLSGVAVAALSTGGVAGLARPNAPPGSDWSSSAISAPTGALGAVIGPERLGAAPAQVHATSGAGADQLRPGAAVHPSGKRLLDLIAATALIVVFGPLLVLVAVAVKLSDGGPILFRQARLGSDGVRFQIAKFRTMVVDAEARLHRDHDLHARYVANGFKLPPDADPRVSPLGRFLRSTSLDELPQLLNVVRGHMSMVGPRPIVSAELVEYEVRGASHAYLGARPGLTGVWQVSGRSNLCYDERVALDVAYFERQSMLNDIKILLRTPAAVLRRDGAQ